MTCWSCVHYRAVGCVLGRPGFPDIGQICAGFDYEPGADEVEPFHTTPEEAQ